MFANSLSNILSHEIKKCLHHHYEAPIYRLRLPVLEALLLLDIHVEVYRKNFILTEVNFEVKVRVEIN